MIVMMRRRKRDRTFQPLLSRQLTPSRPLPYRRSAKGGTRGTLWHPEIDSRFKRKSGDPALIDTIRRQVLGIIVVAAGLLDNAPAKKLTS
jgi:hypothetical protein